jgi:hypothetical protein
MYALAAVRPHPRRLPIDVAPVRYWTARPERCHTRRDNDSTRQLTHSRYRNGDTRVDERADASQDSTASAAAATASLAAPDPLARLTQIRAGVLPILQAIATEYARRVRPGYPMVVDNIERGGVFGLNLDPGYGVYFMTDGTDVYAELHHVQGRTDALAAANAEKFAGRPAITRIELANTETELDYRNLVSRLLSAWNYQQLMINRVDS